MSSNAASMIRRRGEDITCKSRNLGARDATTGHPAITYTDTTIKALVEHISPREIKTAAGEAVDERIRVFTVSTIQYKDRIVYHSEMYEARSEPVSHKSDFREIIMVKVS